MVAVFVVLWIVAIVASGVVLISAMQLLVLSLGIRRNYPRRDVLSFLLALVLIFVNISLIGLLIKFTQEMLAER